MNKSLLFSYSLSVLPLCTDMCRVQNPSTERWRSLPEQREASEEFDSHRQNHPRDPLHIDQDSLPDITQLNMDFRDTSFFRRLDSEGRCFELPSPASINALSETRHARVFEIDEPPMVIKIDDTESVIMEEIQTMRALRQMYSREEVPVPEVFGWRTHEGQVFIYMSFAEGRKLQHVWPELAGGDKERIQGDLSRLVMNLRRIRQDQPQQIGRISLTRRDHEGY